VKVEYDKEADILYIKASLNATMKNKDISKGGGPGGI
jgi:uncharacterized protein YuzE